MKKLLVVLVICALLLPLGCEASDPLSENFYTEDSFIRVDASGNGGYWHEYNMPAIELSPGASGATLIVTNASSLGGYQLNAIGEYLYFMTHVEDDWDGITDGELEIYFEVNDDNSGGLITDEVVLTIEAYHKLEGEQTNTVETLTLTTVVGQSQQHDLFIVEVVVPNLRSMEALAFRINLNTILSEVDDIIVNYVEFKYKAFTSAPEG
jgi:hypothetical protein